MATVQQWSPRMQSTLQAQTCCASAFELGANPSRDPRIRRSPAPLMMCFRMLNLLRKTPRNQHGCARRRAQLVLTFAGATTAPKGYVCTNRHNRDDLAAIANGSEQEGCESIKS